MLYAARFTYVLMTNIPKGYNLNIWRHNLKICFDLWDDTYLNGFPGKCVMQKSKTMSVHFSKLLHKSKPPPNIIHRKQPLRRSSNNIQARQVYECVYLRWRATIPIWFSTVRIGSLARVEWVCRLWLVWFSGYPFEDGSFYYTWGDSKSRAISKLIKLSNLK